MNFSQLVRQQMKEKRLSIRRVSRLAEVDPSFFAKVLRGERNPPDDERVLRRLAEALSLEPLPLLLSVGRLPAEWAAASQRPEMQAALRNLFGAPRVTAGRTPPAPRREPAPPAPKAPAAPPRAAPRVAELSEDLL